MPEWVLRDRILIKFFSSCARLLAPEAKTMRNLHFCHFFVDEEKSSAGRGAIRIKIKLLFYSIKMLTWQWRRRFLNLTGSAFGDHLVSEWRHCRTRVQVADLHGWVNQNPTFSKFKLLSGATARVPTLVWLHTSQKQKAISIPERHIVWS